MSGAGTRADDRLRDLLHLRALPGIGDVRFRRLLERYGSPTRALRAPAQELGRSAAEARDGMIVLGRVERALATITDLGVHVLVHGRHSYPDRLTGLAVPPPIVFARGRLELLAQPAVTVVGSRRATAYGLDVASLLSADLARAGVVVVSGLARGIDRAAHEGALAAGGDTIAVVGCGIDVVWPRDHAPLQERIACDGLLLSEFLPGEPPLRHHFPRRNRILAGLGSGVLVVEAGLKSGAQSTVEHALEAGREVFAVPGPIGRETSAGTNALIRDGATLVTCVEDILAELRLPATRLVAVSDAGGPRSARTPVWPSDSNAAPDASGSGAVRNAGPAVDPAPMRMTAVTGDPEPPADVPPDLWRVLGTDPKHVDELAAAAGLSAPATLTALLTLELTGRAARHSGMRFVRA